MIDTLKATQAFVKRLNGEDLVVASLGNPKIFLAQTADRPRNFYLWNAMGMASSMGLGLAMAQPDKRVFILDGDGALLMNLSSLATTGVYQPKNLVHIVWDNRMYELTGQQPTATSARTDLAKVADGCGYAHVTQVETLEAFEQALDGMLTKEGPRFIHAFTTPERAPKIFPPKSPTFIKHRFMDDLGVAH